VLALAAAAGAKAETVTLTPEALRAQAMAAAQAGQTDLALAYVEALLRRDPTDVAAHLIGSRARRDAGDTAGALAAARAASKYAKTDNEKFTSSLLVAQALATSGRRSEAQLWLRWAAQQAPDDRTRAVAMRDFRYVRSRNRLRVNLTFDVAPSSNVNNGSSEDIVTLFGLPFALSGAAQALSGTRYAGGAELTWRLAVTERQQSHAVMSLFHQTYSLSSEAKAQAPGAEGSDFAYSSAQFGFRQKLSAGEGRGLWGWDVTLGRNWYGGGPLADFGEVGVERTLRVGERATLTFGGDVAYQQRLDGSDDWARAVTLDAAWSRRNGRGDQLRLDVAVEDSTSNDFGLDFTAWSVGAQYRLGKPVMNSVVTFSAGVELRDFPVTPYKAGGREDLSGRLGLELFFPKADYWGFAPVVSLQGSFRESDVDLYDNETISVGIGIRSAF
jgi:hypothetical protein